MPPPDFATPTPAAIEKVSPSLANQLLACELKVAFSRDPSYKSWRRPNTFSALGQVAHAVTEIAYKDRAHAGDEPGARIWLETVWDEQLAQGTKALNHAWAPATPPVPEEWPGYHLTRARTIRRGTRLAVDHEPSPPAAPPTRGMGTEVDLEDPDSGLFGRADRIERWDGATKIIDLKTGLRQGEPTEDQHRQLMLYAVLMQRTTGEWPAEIAIEDAAGKQTSLTLDPEAAERAFTEVLTAVDGFNKRLGHDNIELSARPSADRCRWCAYRVVCGPYWRELHVDWGHRSVMGSIEASGPAGTGTFAHVLIESPVDLAGRTAHVSSIPGSPHNDSTHLAIVDTTNPPETGEMRARWSSLVRTW